MKDRHPFCEDLFVPMFQLVIQRYEMCFDILDDKVVELFQNF